MDKRAGELNAEYLAKAKHTDQTYCGTPRDTVGPVELKLGSLGRVRDIVVGAFGEASDRPPLSSLTSTNLQCLE